MRQVSVQLAPEIASNLQLSRAAQSAQARSLAKFLESHGARIDAMHPGVEDAELATWFYVTVPDGVEPQALATQLLKKPGVLAALLKPLDELP